MRKNNWRSNVKRMMAVMALACMLFGHVGGSAEAGIAPCVEDSRIVDELE